MSTQEEKNPNNNEWRYNLRNATDSNDCQIQIVGHKTQPHYFEMECFSKCFKLPKPGVGFSTKVIIAIHFFKWLPKVTSLTP